MFFLVINFILVNLYYFLQDDFKNQASTAQKQLKDAIDAQGKGDTRLTSAMQTIRSLQEEKSKLNSKLSQKEVSIGAHVNSFFFSLIYCINKSLLYICGFRLTRFSRNQRNF